MEAAEYFDETQYKDRWYVLFVTTGQENAVVSDVKTTFEEGEVRPFVPTLETLFRKSGVVKCEIEVMFPGYVFVETAMENDKFVENIRKCVRKSRHILKLLGYGNHCEAAVMDHERRELETFLSKTNDRIEMSKGIIEGDRIIVTAGPLMGRESRIIRVDRHRMKAVIEVELMGAKREVTMGLEIVRKI